MGIEPFLKYLVVSVFIHHGILLTIEFFSFAHIGTLLRRIVASAFADYKVVFMAIEGVKKKKDGKRLYDDLHPDFHCLSSLTTS